MDRTFSADVVAITHQGLERLRNEDAIGINGWVRSASMAKPVESTHSLDDPLLCFVADGLGGHAAGDLASIYAAHLMAARAERQPLETDEAIVEALREINEAIHGLTDSVAGTATMGTTIAGLAANAGSVRCFNVGDSRVYREQDGFLRLLSVDDRSRQTQPQETVREAPPLPVFHYLTQSLGGSARSETLMPHILTEHLVADRRYVVCSDGVSDVLSVSEMEDCLGHSDVDTVAALFERVIERGAPDNLSVIIVRFREHGSESGSRGVGR